MQKTYGTLKFYQHHKNWAITNAAPHVCIKLKSIFSQIPKGKTQPFNFLDSPEVCADLLWFTERYPLAISDADAKKLKAGKRKYINNINELEKIVLPGYHLPYLQLKPGKEARQYQLIGAELAYKCKRILCGDDIGLGKTLIGILMGLQTGTTPAAVVVQTHMPKQWKAAIEEFTNLRVHIIQGTKPYNLPTADIYIFKYSCLAGWSNFFETGFFKTAVFDETQELRHETSMRYAGAKALSKNATYVLGLTNTPIYNYGSEIFNVLDLIKPGCLGKRDDFMREWIGYNGKVVDDPKALGTYLRDNFLFFKRSRAEVGRELPQINRIVQHVDYDEAEYEKTEALAKQLAIKVLSGAFMERGQAARELDVMLRLSTGVAKAKSVAAFVKILLDNGEPVVLAGWHHKVYEIWAHELTEYNPVFYTGQQSDAQKERAKQSFINAETNLFIISLRSGVGLDGLQHRCKMVVVGELDWSPKIHDQLIGRVDRDGQQEQVTAFFMVTDCGSDPPIIDILGLKSSQSHNILNPLQAMEEQYSDESRMKVFAEKFLQKTNTDVLS